jgi:DNA-binding SARP family transcriptional activator
MTTPLQLKLFGSPQISYQGQPLTGFVSAKVRALLIYLAVTGRPHSRDHLAELLWADTPASTRANLRKALSNLRQLIGNTLVEDGKESIALNGAQVWVDVVEFGRLIKGEADQEAAALYQADFLTGFNLSLSYEFEAWALSEQSRLKSQMIDLLRRIATQHEARNTLSQAILTVRRLLDLEPWHEENHRWLMALLAKDGQQSAALAHFEVCKRVLKEELAVAPNAETLQLVAQIQQATLPVHKPVAKLPAIAQPEFPLIGREREWQTIQDAWHHCLHSGPHFVCLAGEAGIGKTRLTEEARLWVTQQGYASAYARSYAAEGALSYSPVVDWLRSEAIQPQLQGINDLWLSEVARLLPELLIERAHLPSPKPMNEAAQRRLFFEALARAVTASAQPRLLVIDDLHWCDRETLEWLHFLLRFNAKQPLLVVGAFRVEEVGKEHPLHRLLLELRRDELVTDVELAMLSEDATTTLIQLVASSAVSTDQVTALWQTTKGHPLFVVESLRNRAERQGQGALSRKVQNTIQSRFATLSPEARTLASVAAVSGSSFSLPLLVQASQNVPEKALQLLEELWMRRIIQVRGAEQYDFVHDFTRDVAYGEISQIARPRIHKQVAQALILIHAANLSPVNGQIAVHWESAGSFAQAIPYFEQAADDANQLYAHSEAVHYRQKALQLVAQLPDTTENRQRKIDLLLTLGRDRIMTDGWGSQPVAEAWQAAFDLAEVAGTARQRFFAHQELARLYRNQSNWLKSHYYAQEALQFAHQLGDPVVSGHAAFSVASVAFHLGNFSESITYFEETKQWADEGSRDLALYAASLYRSGQCLWLLGFPDQARMRGSRALTLMRNAAHRELCQTFCHYAKILFYRREITLLHQIAQEQVALAIKQGDSYNLLAGRIFEGWSLVQSGAPSAGFAQVQTNFDLMLHKANMGLMFAPMWFGMLGEAAIAANEVETASQAVARGIAYSNETMNRYWLAYLLQLSGDLAQSHLTTHNDAEGYYHDAMALAQQQGAKSLELRAASRLARLWHTQGKTAAAHQLLAPIYGWFTEGFDTPDLLAAQQLLAELQPAHGGVA